MKKDKNAGSRFQVQFWLLGSRTEIGSGQAYRATTGSRSRNALL